MRKLFTYAILLIIGLGLGTGGAWIAIERPAWIPFVQVAKQAEEAEENVKYVGPMHPQIVKDKPGKCPICGMELVKKKVSEIGQKSGSGEKEIKNKTDEQEENVKYVGPMHPQIVRDEPGECPICGMELVKKKMGGDKQASGKGEGGFKPGTIRIDPVVVNNLGVETARVEKTDLSRNFHTVGEVTYDERLVSHMHTRVNGWVEKLYLDAPGDKVQKGDPILEIYSPELVTAQEELLLALRREDRLSRSQGPGVDGQKMIRQTREKLKFYGLSEKEIQEVANTGKYKSTIVLRATQNGVVTELGVREGMRVTPKKMLYTIADLSRVWVQAQVYASNANWVEEGNRVKLEIPFMPGRSWEGKVDYVYPFMEAETRTVTARLVIDNQKGLLKPNMFATANIYASPLEDVLTIPRNSLIRTGKEEVVIQALGDGRFYPREVKAGIESEGRVQIKSGLKPGQKVVTSAQFLIDAESDLQAGMQRMDASSTQDNATSGDKSSGGGGMGHQH